MGDTPEREKGVYLKHVPDYAYSVRSTHTGKVLHLVSIRQALHF